MVAPARPHRDVARSALRRAHRRPFSQQGAHHLQGVDWAARARCTQSGGDGRAASPHARRPLRPWNARAVAAVLQDVRRLGRRRRQREGSRAGGGTRPGTPPATGTTRTTTTSTCSSSAALSPTGPWSGAPAHRAPRRRGPGGSRRRPLGSASTPAGSGTVCSSARRSSTSDEDDTRGQRRAAPAVLRRRRRAATRHDVAAGERRDGQDVHDRGTHHALRRRGHAGRPPPRHHVHPHGHG